MNKIAEFSKVSPLQFMKDYGDEINAAETNKLLESISLPKRGTSGSAGYDFVSTKAFILKPGESIKLPTGIRVKIDEGWFLLMCPRSGLGFKYRVQLDNTIGVIDSDYYNAENEGHIMIKLTNDSRENKSICISVGDRIAQGIFIPYGITKDDNTDSDRTGGFGSTGA